MIDFDLPEEWQALQETTRQLADDHLRPVERVLEAEGPGAELRRRYGEIGLAGVALPEAVGGAALGNLARTVVLEELGAGDPGAALSLDPLGPAGDALLALGGEAALERFAAPLLEPPGARAVLVHDHRPRLRERDGRVSGTLPWLPTDRVDLLVVLEPERAYVLRDGIELRSVRGAGLRSAGASELRLEQAEVAAAWVSTPGARRALAGARLYVAALLVGVMRRALDYARDYAVERVTFGRPIAHHQAIAFLLTDLTTAVEASRALVRDAALRLDAGDEAASACASAFVECCEQALFVTPNALQILGGHGFMLDHPVEKFMRDARALTLLFGGVDVAREDAGADLATVALPVELVATPAGGAP